MPRISEFLGIKIGMFYQEHAPPHFHAVYAEYEAIIGIDPIMVLRGQLRPWNEEMDDDLARSKYESVW